MQRVISTRLRQAGLFEVIDLTDDSVPPCDIEAVAKGQYPTAILVHAYHQHSADAVLFGAVHEYNPYGPLSVGLTLHLVDTREAVTNASVGGHWSTSSEHVRRAFEEFVAQRQSEVADRHAALFSPTAFVDFVVVQLIAGLARNNK